MLQLTIDVRIDMDYESEKMRLEVATFMVRLNSGVHLEARINHIMLQSR